MKMLKRTFAVLLAVMLVVTGIYIAPTEAEEVQAAETLETGVALLYTEETSDTATEVTYDATETPIPVPVDTTYQDYLFAGWFQDATCALEKAVTPAMMAEEGVVEGYYAKFVPRDTLNVKFQTANSAVTDTAHTIAANVGAIRFISSVDSLNYSKIGFDLSCEEDATLAGSYEAKDVFDRIDSTMKMGDAKKEYSFSPKIVGTESEHFFTAKWAVSEANKDKDFTVQAYWITLDGTKVLGDARVVGLQDGNANVLNLTVSGEVSGTTATVTNYTSATGTEYTSAAAVTVLSTDGSNTNVRVVLDGDKTVEELTSAAVVAIGDAKGIYRNYNTSHTDGNATYAAPHADVSWYYAELAVDSTATEFTIATSADLYGCANLVNDKTEQFNGKIVSLVKDVCVNEGNAWHNATSIDSAYAWEPIGWHSNSSNTSPFYGTFDGDGNNVSGLYTVNRSDDSGNYSLSTGYIGFFGCAQSTSKIMNLSVTNSYFDNYSNYTAGIVGYSYASSFENLYSDARLVLVNQSSSVGCVGGIAGRVACGTTQTFENCWFDGNITASGNVYGIGGLVGQHMSDTVGETYNNCLYTGTINCDSTNSTPTVGGLFGAHQSRTGVYAKRVLATNNCIVAGEITVNHSTYEMFTGEITGFMGGSKSIAFTNSYSVCDVKYDGTSEIKEITKDYGDISTYSVAWPEWDKTTDLKNTSLDSLFNSDNDIWMKIENSDVPILSQFKDVWLSTQQ